MVQMARPSDGFHHPHDTPLSASLRFLSELCAWVAGPWAVALVSKWLVLPALIALVGLPAVFSTRNDKRKIVVSIPGPVRIGLELLLYSVAAVAPWFVWPVPAAGLAVGIVVASLGAGIPRFLWLLKGAPQR